MNQLCGQYPSHQSTKINQDNRGKVYKLTSNTKTFAVKFKKNVNQDEKQFLDLMINSKESPMIEVYKHSDAEDSLHQIEYQYFEGGTLDQSIKNLEISDVDSIIEQIGEQLEFIHNNGYVNKNFQLSNIVFGNDPNICNSRIFKLHDFTTIEKTQKTIEFQTDIQSFGNLICELLSKLTLFSEKNIEEIMKINEQLKQSKIDFRQKIKQLRSMTKRMLDSNPDNRPNISEINQFFRSNSIYLNQNKRGESQNKKVEYAKKRIVLIGEPGSGKTTLFNRLTGANEKTASGGSTVTRELVQGYSLYDTNFEVIDVPDSRSIEKGILQAAGLIAGFNVGEINQIIFVVKYARLDSMVAQMKEDIQMVERYLQNITIYISHFDWVNEKDQENLEQDIRDKIFKQFKIKSIIFIRKNINDQTIIIQIANIIQSINSFKVCFTESQIMNDFKYYLNGDDKELVYELENIQFQMIKEFREQKRNLVKYLDNLKLDDTNYFDMLQQLQEMGREQAKQCFQKYQSEQSMRISEQSDKGKQNYLPYILLLKKLNEELKSFFQRIQQKRKAHPKFSNSENDDLITNKDLLNVENTGLSHYFDEDKEKLQKRIYELAANIKTIPQIIKK